MCTREEKSFFELRIKTMLQEFEEKFHKEIYSKDDAVSGIVSNLIYYAERDDDSVNLINTFWGEEFTTELKNGLKKTTEKLDQLENSMSEW